MHVAIITMPPRIPPSNFHKRPEKDEKSGEGKKKVRGERKRERKRRKEWKRAKREETRRKRTNITLINSARFYERREVG